MKTGRYINRLSFIIIFMTLLFAPGQSYQQSYLNSPASVISVADIGIDTIRTMLAVGDIKGAAHIAKLVSSIFALNLQDLRSYNQELTDELHISLLDLPASLEGSSDVMLLLDSIQEGIGSYNIVEENTDLIVVDLLTVADAEYLTALNDENDAAYTISLALFREAKAIFEDDADLNVMLDLEQQSFFNDLLDTVENKGNFVTVGTLTSSIQRDLLGTIVAHDEAILYANIRALYAELLIAVDAGDYQKAEELAIEAYLENFEYLEPALEAADAEFMYALEIDMREDLRDMIRSEADPAEIRSFIEDSILPDLAEGEAMTVALLVDAGGIVPAAERELRERGDSTNEQQQEVRDEIDFIRATLQDLLHSYEDGDYNAAYVAARTAYLDSYEYIEIPLRPIAPDFTLEVEYQFAELRNLIKEQASYDEVRSIIVELERHLDESERLVTGSGQVAPAIAFTASFAIIFREGLEAVLILGAIITYLEASRNVKFKRHVYYGIIAAIGATAATWFTASYIIEISGASRELIEAIAALSATAVLFYVSFWILNKIEHKKWMEFVKARIWQATTTGSAIVFVSLAFFTVYREGFETVLFYQAMFGFAKYLEVYVGLGFVIGMSSLLILYFVMRKLGKRLPLRALFGLTMGIGAYLSIAFLGNAIRELQVLDVVPYTSMLGTIPRLDINLATMTGIYPTLETVIGQIVLLGIYLAASSYVLIIRPKKERKLAQMRKSRKEDD